MAVVPRKPEWVHRIPAALEALENSPAMLLDRRAIEELLEVSPRQAIRLLNRLGACQAGKNLLIPREELRERLRSIANGDEVHYERRRLQAFDVKLAGARSDCRSRKVPIEAGPQSHWLLLPSLPPTVRLRPGRLEIDFETPEELLARLYELSQAIANDYDLYQKQVTQGLA